MSTKVHSNAPDNSLQLFSTYDAHSSLSSLSWPFAFGCFLVPALISASYATISDCDEVFNYWEPTHYLMHGNGLQTWEYSPEYAIRSWLYVGLHGVVSRLPSISSRTTKVDEFYFLRYILATVCAACETRLYYVISKEISSTVGLVFGITLGFSAGMYNATAAYLPSTFAMYFAMLGLADSMQPKRTAQAVFWFAVAGLMGWPFALAFAIPFVLQTAIEPIANGNIFTKHIQLFKGGCCSIVLLICLVAVDSAAYKRLAVVPLNIVLYNVFGGAGRGPNIFGTEPWWFYIANVALNFNVILLLGIMCIPLMLVTSAFGVPTLQQSVYITVAPFYLWFGIFSLQPHKEERFMFVAYPVLCLNAAISTNLLQSSFATLAKKWPKLQMPSMLLQLGLYGIIALGCAISISRTVAITSAYSAPLMVYTSLPSDATGNLCIGKEWYRFPSSYLLPDNVRARFIKSSFDGLLPGEFPEVNAESWSRPGTWMVPTGMNDENKEDLGKYVDVQQCKYLVDSHFEGLAVNDLEPSYVSNTKDWRKVRCEKFLDASNTPTWARTLYLPLGMFKKARKWGEYCLLERRD